MIASNLAELERPKQKQIIQENHPQTNVVMYGRWYKPLDGCKILLRRVGGFRMASKYRSAEKRLSF